MKNVWLKRGWIAVLVILMLMSVHAIGGDDVEEIFLGGVIAYRSGDFDQSVAAFESLAQMGIQNGSLFYNLGNAYLKQDRLGHAVLWYGRFCRCGSCSGNIRCCVLNCGQGWQQLCIVTIRRL